MKMTVAVCCARAATVMNFSGAMPELFGEESDVVGGDANFA